MKTPWTEVRAKQKLKKGKQEGQGQDKPATGEQMTLAEIVAKKINGQGRVRVCREAESGGPTRREDTRPVRIMVKARESTYGEVLRRLQRDLPKETSEGVNVARKTKAGNLVMEVGKTTTTSWMKTATPRSYWRTGD